MSANYCISGFIPPDEKWKDMKAIWDACEKAGIDVPNEVGDFFEWEKPSDLGRQTDLIKFAHEVSDDGMYGFDIDVSKIPENVKTIRFYVRY